MVDAMPHTVPAPARHACVDHRPLHVCVPGRFLHGLDVAIRFADGYGARQKLTLTIRAVSELALDEMNRIRSA